MPDNGGLSKTEPGRSQQLKRTYDMSFSKTKEDSSGPQLSETRTREAMREAEGVNKVTSGRRKDPRLTGGR